MIKGAFYVISLICANYYFYSLYLVKTGEIADVEQQTSLLELNCAQWNTDCWNVPGDPVMYMRQYLERNNIHVKSGQLQRRNKIWKGAFCCTMPVDSLRKFDHIKYGAFVWRQCNIRFIDSENAEVYLLFDWVVGNK